MALWELEEFQGPRLLGFVRAVPPPAPFVSSRWLPDRPVFDLAFEYLKGAQGKNVMAHVMGFDAEAPIAGRPGLGERITGELPPIKRKARISEKELIRFLTPRAGTPDVQTAINSVYDDVTRLLDSIQARVEWLRMQALSEDKIVYNENGVIINFDFGLNDTLQINLVTQADGAGATVAADVGPVWTDTVNSTPIPDIEFLTNRQEDVTGFRPDELVLSRKALGYVFSSTNTRNLIRGSGAPSAPLTRAEVDTLLTLYGLPNLVTYDVKVHKENPDGTTSEVRTMADNKAFLYSAASGVGETLWGPTAESRSLIGTPLASRAPGSFAVTYATEEPPAEWIKAAAVVFPTMPAAERLAQFTLW